MLEIQWQSFFFCGSAAGQGEIRKLLPADEVFEIGIDRTIAVMQERIGNNPVYITFDLDVLDPADAPGIANLEAG